MAELLFFFFFKEKAGIRIQVRSRGLENVKKGQQARRLGGRVVVQDFGPVETLARTADDDTHAGALPGAPRTAMAQDITAHEPDQASVASGDDRLIATCRQQFRRATAQRRVRFRFDSSVLQSSAYALLDALAEIAADCPGLRIRITGHTDASGDPVHNQFLSEQRAAAVRAYFVARGIRAERLTAIGKGASQPLDRGSDRAARARNRRIDFALVANE